MDIGVSWMRCCSPFLFLLLMFFSVQVHAAPVDDVMRQQQQMQQLEEQRRQMLEQEHLEKMRQAPEGEDMRLPAAPEAEPGAAAFEATSIEVSGITLLSKTEIDALTAPYIGRKLTLADVNNLIRDITNAYIEKGYVTTRAAVPPQDFSSGKLVIIVIEGKVEAIEFKDDDGHQRELKTAFPWLEGNHLVAKPGKTTTVLGRYTDDMKDIISELDYPKTLDFDGKPGGFNVLNAPDELYKTSDQFWAEYNKPFLDAAIERGDDIVLATRPQKHYFDLTQTPKSGFEREFKHLLKNDYIFDENTMKMIKK